MNPGLVLATVPLFPGNLRSFHMSHKIITATVVVKGPMRALQGLKCLDSHHKSQWKEYWPCVKIVSFHMPPINHLPELPPLSSPWLFHAGQTAPLPPSFSPAGAPLAEGQPHQYSLLWYCFSLPPLPIAGGRFLCMVFPAPLEPELLLSSHSRSGLTFLSRAQVDGLLSQRIFWCRTRWWYITSAVFLFLG